jgi:hypothetical protein
LGTTLILYAIAAALTWGFLDIGWTYVAQRGPRGHRSPYWPVIIGALVWPIVWPILIGMVIGKLLRRP